MAITIRTMTGTNAGDTVTLPTGINNGDIGVIDAATNLLNGTLGAAPNGWTLVFGPDGVGGGRSTMARYRKVLTTADSGTSVTIPWSATSGKHTVGGYVVSGATDDQPAIYGQDSVISPTVNVPAITPDSDNCLLVYSGQFLYAANNTTIGLTPPAGWTELYDIADQTSGSVDPGVYCMSKQLTGGAGVSQPATTMTGTGDVRDNHWVTVWKPTATTGTTYQFTGTTAATTAVAGALTALLALTGTTPATSTVSGAMTRVTRTYPMAGTVAATTGVAGALDRKTLTLALTGTIPATSSVTGDLTRKTLTLSMSGTVAAVSAVNGSMDRAAQGLAFTGTIVAATNVTGSLDRVNRTWALAGSTDATTTVAGDMTALLGMTGAVDATSDVAGDLTRAVQTLELTGSIDLQTTVRGAMTKVGAINRDVTIIAGPVSIGWAAGTLTKGWTADPATGNHWAGDAPTTGWIPGQLGT